MDAVFFLAGKPTGSILFWKRTGKAVSNRYFRHDIASSQPNIYKSFQMTFEIAFEHKGVAYTAVATLNGKDFLVNLISPVQYEVTPTMAFSVHDDESMNYSNSMFEDMEFMPAIETALRDHMHKNNIVIE